MERNTKFKNENETTSKWKENNTYYILKKSTFWSNCIVFHSDDYCRNCKSELIDNNSELAEFYEDPDIPELKGVFHSAKFGRDILYTTKQQEIFLQLAERKNDIVSLVEKPFLLKYDGDLFQLFCPDFLFFDSQGLGRVVMLVSYNKFATQETQNRIIALKKYCQAKGLGYIVIDLEKNISFKWLTEKGQNRDGWNNLFEDSISAALAEKRSHWLNEEEILKICKETNGNLMQLQLFSLIHQWLYSPATPARKILLVGSEKDGLADSSKIMGIYNIKNWRKNEKGYKLPSDSNDIVGEVFLEKEIVKTCFDNIIMVRKDEKYGIENSRGKIILPCVFQKIDMAIDVEENNVFRIIFLGWSDKNILLISFDGENTTTEKQFELL